jgi:plastocyanin
MRTRRTRLVAIVFAVALIAAACGGSGSTDDSSTTTAAGAETTTTAPPTTSTTAAGEPTTTSDATDTTVGGALELAIAAEDSEGFTKDRLKAQVGQEVTVVFQNKDVGGEPHNWHIVVETGSEEYATLIRQGPDTQSVTFTIGKPGDYQFFCDTHSVAMRGILTVTP